MAVLAVDVAAVRERHCAAAVSLRRLRLNKVFDSNIALIASFVTAVDNSSSCEPTAVQQDLFLYFLSILLWLSNNTQYVLFYKVKWQHWLGEVDY